MANKYIDKFSFAKYLDSHYCDRCKAILFVNDVDFHPRFCWSCRIKDVMNDLETYPTEDVEERKHGKWIPIPDEDAPYYEKSDWIGCSECRQYAHYTRITDKPILSNFCPNCGARMRGDSDV